MAQRKRGRPRKRKTPTYRLGKASSLPGELWGLWLKHVWKLGPSWLWVALFLSHCLCLRITEVLKLKAEDFQWKQKSVKIAPLKRQVTVHKHVLSTVAPFLRALRSKGCKRKRIQKKGARGTVVWTDEWSWPTAGRLFPSTRSDAHDTHRNKDTVCKRISALRKTFDPPHHLIVDQTKIRSHSGRHRMINDRKVAKGTDEVAMTVARSSDRRTFMGYGELTDEQAGRSLEDNKELLQAVKQL